MIKDPALFQKVKEHTEARLGPEDTWVRDMKLICAVLKMLLGKTKVTAQCAGLILAYSRTIFIQFYPLPGLKPRFLLQGFCLFPGRLPKVCGGG